MMQVLIDNPELHPLIPVTRWLYAERQGDLWYYGNGGSADPPVTTIKSAMGVRQGCVLGAVLFAIAVAPTFLRIHQSIHESGLFMAIADDGTVAGSPAAIEHMLRTAPDLLRQLNLTMNPGKAALYVPASAAVGFEPLLASDVGQPLAQIGGLKSLGVPLGSDPYVQQRLVALG
jgi:hypothetical protein